MKLPKYPLASSEAMMTFDFVSEGRNGRIPKLVRYQPTNLAEVYNLAFGDKNEQTGEIDDTAVSDNDDRDKVLTTVVATLYAFTDKYPNAFVYATGSTPARIRLYRMGIAKFLSEVEADFEVLGEVGEDWEPFKKEGDYEGFLVRRK